jgi:hypothetical protein
VRWPLEGDHEWGAEDYESVLHPLGCACAGIEFGDNLEEELSWSDPLSGAMKS